MGKGSTDISKASDFFMNLQNIHLKSQTPLTGKSISENTQSIPLCFSDTVTVLFKSSVDSSPVLLYYTTQELL